MANRTSPFDDTVDCGTIGTLDAGVANGADVATSLFDAEVSIDLVRM